MTDTEIEQLAEEFLEKMKRASNRWEAGVHMWTAWALVEAFKAGALLAAPVAAQEPDRRVLQAEGKHPAPCARFCEANAFQIEIRNLKAQLAAKPAPGERQPDDAKDAARYRWMRNNAMTPATRWSPRIGIQQGSTTLWRYVKTEQEFDAALDQEMQIGNSR